MLVFSRTLVLARDTSSSATLLLLGTNETRGQLMFCPQLEAYVAGEFGKEGAVLKERRKLKEEKGLVRP